MLKVRDRKNFADDKIPDSLMLRFIAFASKRMSSAKRQYSNIEREALGILHELEIFNHFYIAREVSIITVHKPLVAIFLT